MTTPRIILAQPPHANSVDPDSAERRRFLNAVYQADDGDYGSDDEFIDLFDPDIH